MVWVLHQDLVSASNLKLLDLKGHASNSFSPVFKPQRIVTKITIELVLLWIWLEKLSLCEEIVMSLHLILDVYIVVVIHKLARFVSFVWRLVHTFCHVRRNPYKVLIWLGLFQHANRLFYLVSGLLVFLRRLIFSSFLLGWLLWRILKRSTVSSLDMKVLSSGLFLIWISFRLSCKISFAVGLHEL